MLYPIILRIRHLWDFEERRLFSNVFFSSENFNPLIWIWCNEREKTNLLLFWRKKRKVSFSVILFKPLRCFNIEKSWNTFSSYSMFNVKFFPKKLFPGTSFGIFGWCLTVQDINYEKGGFISCRGKIMIIKTVCITNRNEYKLILH